MEEIVQKQRSINKEDFMKRMIFAMCVLFSTLFVSCADIFNKTNLIEVALPPPLASANQVFFNGSQTRGPGDTPLSEQQKCDIIAVVSKKVEVYKADQNTSGWEDVGVHTLLFELDTNDYTGDSFFDDYMNSLKNGFSTLAQQDNEKPMYRALDESILSFVGMRSVDISNGVSLSFPPINMGEDFFVTAFAISRDDNGGSFISHRWATSTFDDNGTPTLVSVKANESYMQVPVVYVKR